MYGNCHFNLRASTTPQHNNPHPAVNMTVLRAPHQTTASASLAKFSNRSKPCCQPVKAMLQNWSPCQSHVAKVINWSKLIRRSAIFKNRHTKNHFIALQGLLPMHTVGNRLQKSGSISLIINDSPSIILYKLTATSASRSPPSDSCTPTLCMPIKC